MYIEPGKQNLGKVGAFYLAIERQNLGLLLAISNGHITMELIIFRSHTGSIC